MSKLYKFLSAFGLSEGATIAGYQLHMRDLDKEVITRNYQYLYTGLLYFIPNPNADQDQLLSHFTNLINMHITVYGKRFPYDCVISITSIIIDPNNKIVRMNMMGGSIRMGVASAYDSPY